MDQEIQHNFFETLRHFDQMPEVDVPDGLHGRIMRSLYLQQFKLPLVVINSILFLNLLISGVQLWSTNEGSFRAAMQTFGNAGPTGAFVPTLAKAWSALPLESGAVFLANLALVTAGIYLLWRLRSLMSMAKNASK